MMIETLNSTRRNVMIPRYWRHVEETYISGAIWFNTIAAGGTYTITSSTFTPTDPCHIKIRYNCWLSSVFAWTGAWTAALFQLGESVGGGAWNIIYSTWHSFYDSDVANNWTVEIQFISQNKNANQSLQYGINVGGNGVDGQVLQQVLDIEICRE